MQTQQEQNKQLWEKFLANKATPAELERLFESIEATHDTSENWMFIQEGFALENGDTPGFTAMDEEQKRHLIRQWQAAQAQRPVAGKVRRLNTGSIWRWAAAAVVLVCAGIVYRWQQHPPKAGTAAAAREITPGRNGAILTLADGSQVILDSAGKAGIVARQNGAQVVLENGVLAYQAAGNATAETAYNTIQTPRGRQFTLTLPDGTSVWLNSASSIRYPTVFNGTQRRVEVTGEAYFEVAKNVRQPFVAAVPGKEEVEVLGTAFNINAYSNEADVRTTLVTGVVRVSNTPAQVKQRGVLLHPAQQAVINSTAAIKVVDKVDTDKVTAWKNGFFNFEGMSLQQAMQQLERWYDIEVVYENGIPAIPFEGEISRNVSLEGLLKMLAGADLTFRVEKGRKLIIINK